MNEKKVILLTGCGSGIGRHMAGVLAKEGHCLIATDVNEAGLEETARLHGWTADQVTTQKLDVRDSTAWQQMIQFILEKWGRLDLTMNIAGILTPSYVTDTTSAEIDLQVDVNVKGVIYGTIYSAQQMVKQGDGHIINIASLAGVAPIPGLSVYSATKHAVRSYSIAAAIELRPKGVTVTTICPDVVETPMLEIQLFHQAAALSFSGAKPLTVQDVEKAIFHALHHKTTEITLPRSRGWLAKVAGVLPKLGFWIAPRLTQKGLANQTKRQTQEVAVQK